ncbi:hypothetical protein KAU39_05825 [bacterium]|nr:hypothetical protein [bacterium]
MEQKIVGFCLINLFLCCLILFSHAKAKKEDVTITADQMEVLQKEDVFSFFGNVKLTQGKNIITADRMKNFEKKGVIKGEGNVYFSGTVKDNEKVEVYGEKVIYYKNRNFGVITGNPKMIRKAIDSLGEKKIVVTCERIEADLNKEEVSALGNVRFSRESVKGEGEKGLYFNKTKRMILSGSPQIFYEDEKNKSTYEADEITILVNRKKIFLEGNVMGSVVPKGRN